MSKREPTVVFSQSEYRVVMVPDSAYHIEKERGTDAMMHVRWDEIGRCYFRDDANESEIELPRHFVLSILHIIARRQDAEQAAYARGRREALALAETIVERCEVGPETESLRTLILNELRGLQ